MKTLYQISLLQALANGMYDGVVDVNTLKSFSNTAIGTFLGADGELIMLDGLCYKATLDGTIKEVNNSETIPFSNACMFVKDDEIKLGCSNITELKKLLHEFKNNKYKNLFMVIKISGLFKSITTRSLPKQNKPYKPLDYVAEHEQKVITNKNISGTVIGFCTPSFMDKLNTIDYHMHFISSDKKIGGHVLDLSFDEITIEVSIKNEFKLILNENKDFVLSSLECDKDKIKKVEE